MKYKVLICGSRNWRDFYPIKKHLESYLAGSKPNEVTVIHGDCSGADKIAGWLANKMGMNVVPVAADWARYGNAAGPIRNQKMLDEYKPDLVAAFHDDLACSKGTKDMVTRAKRQGFAVRCFTSQGEVSV